MTRKRLSVERCGELLPMICYRDTSADPNGWTDDNPMWGQCTVVALLVQKMYGGTLLRASLENTAFASMRSYYWNLLDDGQEHDLSRSQFGFGLVAPVLVGEPRTREYVLSNEETAARYECLVERAYGRLILWGYDVRALTSN